MTDLNSDELLLNDPIRLSHLGHELAHPVQCKGVGAVVTTPGHIAMVAGQYAAFHLASTLRREPHRPSIPQFLTEHNSGGHPVLSQRCREGISGRKVLVVGDHRATLTMIKEVCDAVTVLGATVVGVSFISLEPLDDKDFVVPGCITTIVNPDPTPGQAA